MVNIEKEWDKITAKKNLNLTDNCELMICKYCKFYNGNSCSERHTVMSGTSSIPPSPEDSCKDWEKADNVIIKDPDKKITNFERDTGIEEQGWLYEDKKGIKRVSIPKLTDEVLSSMNIRTLFGTKYEDVYVYDDGIWKNKGKEFIKKKTEEIADFHSKNNVVNEVYEKIKRITIISKEEFETIPINLICLENGIFDIKEWKFIQGHNPNYYFKTKIPIHYNPNAKCPEIMKFINEAFYSEDIPTLQEWFGFQLYRSYFIKKAVILFGPKDTGKTIFLNLLTKFIGEKNKTGVSLHKISSNNNFVVASLENKHSNIYDDLSSDDISDEGGFKIATGGGYISAEHKFGDPFQFRNFAKHTFATNKIPAMKNTDDDAAYSRWMPIPCDNEVPKEEQDRFLEAKITTPEEMAGLLNWALEGLKRLLQTGKFSFSKDVQEIRAIMQRHNNPLVAFAQDCLQQKDNGRISKERMYELYVWYIQKQKKLTGKDYPVLSKEQLGRQLPRHASYIMAKNDTERYWANVGVTNYDTLDTFFKTYIEKIEIEKVSMNIRDIISENVSNLSKSEEIVVSTNN